MYVNVYLKKKKKTLLSTVVDYQNVHSSMAHMQSTMIALAYLFL